MRAHSCVWGLLALVFLLTPTAQAGGADDDAPLLPRRKYRYYFTRGTEHIGSLEFTLDRKRDAEGRLRYVLQTDYEIQRPPTDSEVLDATLTLSASLRPIRYEKRLKVHAGGRPAESGDYQATFDFRSDQVRADIKRNGREYLRADVHTPVNVPAFDANCAGQLSLIIGALPLKDRSHHVLRVFSVSSLRVVELGVHRVARNEVKVNARPFDCWELEITVDGEPVGTYWLSVKEKRLICLKLNTGGIMIVAVD